MNTLRLRALGAVDRGQEWLLVALLSGGILAFGTQIWWGPPAFGAIVIALVVAGTLRAMLLGSIRLRRSPLGMIGLAALGLGVLQLAPLPASLATRLSPRSQAFYALGVVPEMALEDDPDRAIPEPAAIRSAATLDRPATLRWLLGAAACLAVFGATASGVDRIRAFYAMAGAIVAGFAINGLFGLMQTLGGSGKLYGVLRPGESPAWAPSTLDVLASPTPALLRTMGEGPNAWAATIPRPIFLMGSLLGGPGAFLALASLALPLALALALHMMAPRGSREPLAARLRDSGRTSLVTLLLGTAVVGAGLVGCLAGPVLAVPFALALLVAGLLGSAGTGLGRIALSALVVSLSALGIGVVASRYAPLPDGVGGPSAFRPLAALESWKEAARIARDYPMVGAGLGAFPTIGASYKDRDETTTAEQSTLSRWAAESGLAGLALLAAAAAWCVVRLPKALGRVDTADRALAGGLLAAVIGFALFAAMHWTIEVGAIALAASAVLGAFDRWLAGGTDLFVEGA